MFTKDSAKSRATRLRDILKSLGHDVPHSHCLETIARQNGYADWNTCAASLVRQGEILPPPVGWAAGGDRREHYLIGLDASQRIEGVHPAIIRYREDAPKDATGFATFVQSFDAGSFIGKRIRFAARLGSVDCNGAATLWFRADSSSRQAVAFDNLEGYGVDHESGPISGTTQWTDRQIVLDIPNDAERISMGFYLRGTGTAYAVGFQLDAVSAEVPVTVGAPVGNGDPINLSLTE